MAKAETNETAVEKATELSNGKIQLARDGVTIIRCADQKEKYLADGWKEVK